MARKQNQDVFITVRTTPALKRSFTMAASKFGTPSDVARELIRAFCENRVTIKAPANQESLYVT